MRARVEASGKEIVDLSPEQVANFAGNAIELHDSTGAKLLVLSTPRSSNVRSRTTDNINSPRATGAAGTYRRSSLVVAAPGCMIATIHLPAA